MRYSRHLAALCCAAIILAGGAGFVIAQTVAVPVELRIAAQRHESGAVEVALEHGGERHLPDSRFVLPRFETGRWLRSSPVTISVDAPVPVPEVVERIVEVPVEPPVVRLSVRPSDHEDGGLVCFEQMEEDGNTWSWTDEQTGEATGHSTAFGVYSAGVWSGWARALGLEGFPEADWLDFRLSAAWHAQCSEYHGVDIGRPEEFHATEPDDWKEG
ncbi:MAG: hypothetical protein F4Z51_07025 [Chloroflexi bacterium]|nr:hypothetical protein [Chloroflexota bacterium]MYD17778.1 hypothetical protein [Chloroflexota bacterium]